ncbi:energy transducer TonB [Leadbettera azotonutricia]|uniref:Putative TonB protein n=1 Tax=Leadbettera azotonutricia (strain ATCC BAA-888 / DSM 13862 / ZAS-9) TaxID=545695 RepID=F5YCT8_LEAAZ|nr:energy transducer TonB [Leadbettera azotonutricia]AEF81461.1 putative TonB protein [Leadbettera azotonutricia ZAS-9]
MPNAKHSGENKIRLLIFMLVAALHGILLFFVVFHFKNEIKAEEPPANVMKLVDVREQLPPPPPPRERPPEIVQNTVEAVAETMIETDEVPDAVITSTLPYVEEETIEYLPMNKVSRLPEFPEDQIKRAIVYPPIALRSNIEGTVYLELFVDRQGVIRQISILRETPEGRGFGEAAVNAFKGIQGKPAESNGQIVAVRYRYPIRFTIR